MQYRYVLLLLGSAGFFAVVAAGLTRFLDRPAATPEQDVSSPLQAPSAAKDENMPAVGVDPVATGAPVTSPSPELAPAVDESPAAPQQHEPEETLAAPEQNAAVTAKKEEIEEPVDETKAMLREFFKESLGTDKAEEYSIGPEIDLSNRRALHAHFRQEARDEEWAGKAEAALSEYYSRKPSLNSYFVTHDIECRTNLCQVMIAADQVWAQTLSQEEQFRLQRVRDEDIASRFAPDGLGMVMSKDDKVGYVVFVKRLEDE